MTDEQKEDAARLIRFRDPLGRVILRRHTLLTLRSGRPGAPSGCDVKDRSRIVVH